ncbi:MAG: hypothetical protein R3299_03135 [Arenibacter sp.]|nr:hypothetical protein [Arenibacter sp.]
MKYFKLKIVVLALMGKMALGCTDHDDDAKPTNCDYGVIISADQFEHAPSNRLVINELEIDDDCLRINFSSSGCSGETWKVKLIDSDKILESDPPQRTIRLSLKNEELCEAFITTEATFDISNLQVAGNRVVLNITNSEENILYTY